MLYSSAVYAWPFVQSINAYTNDRLVM